MGELAPPAPPARLRARVTLEATPAAYTVRSGEAVVTISRATGRITRAAVQGRTVLVGGPKLMLLPLSNASGGDGGTAGNDFRAGIEPFSPVCRGWSCAGVDARTDSDGGATITVGGAYTEATGTVTYRFPPEGGLRIAYRFQMQPEVNPRQWGITLYAPADMDRVSWLRHTAWTAYPSDHIGRPVGAARANPGPQDTERNPTGPWALDRAPLGSADFRSTRAGILRAALREPTGLGCAVISNGAQAVRAFVDGPRIGLLVADYNTGGADGFFATHYAAERRPPPPRRHHQR